MVLSVLSLNIVLWTIILIGRILSLVIDWLIFLGYIANIILLDANQTFSPTTNPRETKTHIPDIFSDTEPNKLNNFLFQYHLYFYANPI